MVLGGRRDLMDPLDSVNGYVSLSLWLIVVFVARSAFFYEFLHFRLSDCLCSVSTSTSVTSVDLVGLRCGSHCAGITHLIHCSKSISPAETGILYVRYILELHGVPRAI